MSERVQHDSRSIRPVPHRLSADLRLWWVDLDAYADADSMAGLEESDYTRAGCMAFEQDGRRFLAGRHALRSLVARETGRIPGELVIEPDALGKPRLPDGEVRFNLSHSGRYGLVGISREREVGVDVELVRPVPELESLARDQFTVGEQAEWRDADPTERDRRFLECWTRKEACAKALGTGLLIQPRLFEVGCSPDTRLVTVSAGGTTYEVNVCSVHLAADVVAAAASDSSSVSAFR